VRHDVLRVPKKVSENLIGEGHASACPSFFLSKNGADKDAAPPVSHGPNIAHKSKVSQASGAEARNLSGELFFDGVLSGLSNRCVL
jgi:hypothetical protein